MVDLTHFIPKNKIKAESYQRSQHWHRLYLFGRSAYSWACFGCIDIWFISFLKYLCPFHHENKHFLYQVCYVFAACSKTTKTHHGYRYTIQTNTGLHGWNECFRVVKIWPNVIYDFGLRFCLWSNPAPYWSRASHQCTSDVYRIDCVLEFRNMMIPLL